MIWEVRKFGRTRWGWGRRWPGSCRLGRFGKVEHDDVMHFRVYAMTSSFGREPATQSMRSSFRADRLGGC